MNQFNIRCHKDSNTNINNKLSLNLNENLFNLNDIEKKLNLIPQYIKEKEYTQAFNILQSLCNDFEKGWDAIEKEPNCDYFSFDTTIEFIIHKNSSNRVNDFEDISIGNFSISWMYHRLAYVLSELNDHQTAKSVLEKALKWNPYSIDTMNEFVAIYFAEQNYSDALKTLKKMFKYASTPNQLALIYRQLGYYNSEIKNWDLAYKLYWYSIKFESSNIALNELKYIVQNSDIKISDEPTEYAMKVALQEMNIPLQCSELIFDTNDELLDYLAGNNQKTKFLEYKNNFLKILVRDDEINTVQNKKNLNIDYSLNKHQEYKIRKTLVKEYLKNIHEVEDIDEVKEMLNQYINTPNDELLEDIELEFSISSNNNTAITVNREKLKSYHFNYKDYIEDFFNIMLANKLQSGKATVQLSISSTGYYTYRILDSDNSQLDKVIHFTLSSCFYTITPPPYCYEKKCINININLEKYQCDMDKDNISEERIAELTEEINVNGDNEKIYFERAIIEHELGQLSNALNDFKKCIELNILNDKYYYWISKVKLRLNNIDDALKNIDKAIELNSNKWKYYIQHCFIQYKMKEYDKVIRDCEVAINITSDCSIGYYYKAKALNQLGKLEDALENLDKAIDIDDNDDDFYYERAHVKCSLEDYNGGIEDFSDAIAIISNIPEYYYYRARAKYELCKFEDAISDYNKAIELENDNHLFYYKRAITKCELNDFENAIIDIDTAINIEPDIHYYYRLRAIAKEELNIYDEALEDFNIAIKLCPTDSEYYQRRGCIKCSLETFSDAILDFDKAIELNLNNAKAYHYRGVAKGNLNLFEDAIQDFNKAMDIRPNSATLMLRAMTYEDLKLYDEAIQDYNVVIEKEPDNQRAYFLRSGTYFKLEKYKEALNDINIVLKYSPNTKDYKDLKNIILSFIEPDEDLDENPNIDISEEFDNAWDYYQMAQDKIGNKQYTNGFKYLNKAIELEPDNIDILLYRAITCSRIPQLLDYKTAITDMTIAINEVSVPAFFKIRAYAELKLEQYEKSLEDYSVCLKEDENNVDAEVYFGLGKSEYMLGNYDYAIEYLDKSIELAEENSEDNIDINYYYKGLAYKALNHYDDAVTNFEQANRINPDDKYINAINIIREEN